MIKYGVGVKWKDGSFSVYTGRQPPREFSSKLSDMKVYPVPTRHAISLMDGVVRPVVILTEIRPNATVVSK